MFLSRKYTLRTDCGSQVETTFIGVTWSPSVKAWMSENWSYCFFFFKEIEHWQSTLLYFLTQTLETKVRKGNGTPLQYPCLENPMDGGAWKAVVHGVAEGQTQLSNFTFTFHFHALEKEMATHSSVLAWRIPGTGEPGGLPSMGWHRVGHDWSNLAAAAAETKVILKRIRAYEECRAM